MFRTEWDIQVHAHQRGCMDRSTKGVPVWICHQAIVPRALSSMNNVPLDKACEPQRDLQPWSYKDWP